MADFWSRLVDQAGGRFKAVLPLVGPRFAPVPMDALAASANMADERLAAEPLPDDPIEWPSLVAPESVGVTLPTLRRLAQSAGEDTPIRPLVQEPDAIQDFEGTASEPLPDASFDKQSAVEPHVTPDTPSSKVNETTDTAGTPRTGEGAQPAAASSTIDSESPSPSASGDTAVFQRRAAPVETQLSPVAPDAAPGRMPETAIVAGDAGPPLPVQQTTADGQATAEAIQSVSDAVLDPAATGDPPEPAPQTVPPAGIRPLPVAIDAPKTGTSAAPLEGSHDQPESSRPHAQRSQAAARSTARPDVMPVETAVIPSDQLESSTGELDLPQTLRPRVETESAAAPQATTAHPEKPLPIRPQSEGEPGPLARPPELPNKRINPPESTTANPAVPQQVEAADDLGPAEVQAIPMSAPTVTAEPAATPPPAAASHSVKMGRVNSGSKTNLQLLDTPIDLPEPAVAQTYTPEPVATEADVPQTSGPYVEPDPARAISKVTARSLDSPAADKSGRSGIEQSGIPAGDAGQTPAIAQLAATANERQVAVPQTPVQPTAPLVATAAAAATSQQGTAAGVLTLLPPLALLSTQNEAAAQEIRPIIGSRTASITRDAKSEELPVQPLIATPSLAAPARAPRPTIRVTIGRVEVRTKTEPPPPPRRSPAAPKPAISLDDYLRGGTG